MPECSECGAIVQHDHVLRGHVEELVAQVRDLEGDARAENARADALAAEVLDLLRIAKAARAVLQDYRRRHPPQMAGSRATWSPIWSELDDAIIAYEVTQ